MLRFNWFEILIIENMNTIKRENQTKYSKIVFTPL